MAAHQKPEKPGENLLMNIRVQNKKRKRRKYITFFCLHAQVPIRNLLTWSTSLRGPPQWGKMSLAFPNIFSRHPSPSSLTDVPPQLCRQSQFSYWFQPSSISSQPPPLGAARAVMNGLAQPHGMELSEQGTRSSCRLAQKKIITFALLNTSPWSCPRPSKRNLSGLSNCRIT